MLYLIIKLLLTIICWFLIFTLFNFILGTENNGVVRYVNKLNSTQYMSFILGTLLIGFILNLLINSGNFYYKWLFTYSLVPIFLYCLNKYRVKK